MNVKRWIRSTVVKARITCLALTVAGLSVGCGERRVTATGVEVTWQVHPDPPDTGYATVSAALADSAGTPLRGADVAFEGIMTHPGMGPVHADAREIAPGRYQGRLHLTMRGDWILLLNATLADGRSLRAQYALPGVGTR